MAPINGTDTQTKDDLKGDDRANQRLEDGREKPGVDRLEVPDRSNDGIPTPENGVENSPHPLPKSHKGKDSTPGGRVETPDDRKRVQLYLLTLKQVVSVDQWQELCERTLELALQGDWRAREWISFYLVGRPIERVQVDVDQEVHIVAELPPIVDQRVPRIVGPVIDAITKEIP